MRTYTHSIFLILFCTIFIMDCGKEIIKAPPKLNTEDIMTGHYWVPIAKKINGVSEFPNCEQDDLISFSKNSELIRHKLGVKCGPSEYNDTIPYSIDVPNNQITIVVDGAKVTFDILTMTDSLIKFNGSWFGIGLYIEFRDKR
jgi:hypothetical protein